MLDFNKYIGIPFVDGGRDLSGLDCWGLVKILHSDIFDNELPDFNISAFDTASVIEAMGARDRENHWKQVDEPDVGDIFAMGIHPMYPEFVNHVGFYIGKNMILHTQKNHGSFISKTNDPVYKNCIKGIYRWVA